MNRSLSVFISAFVLVSSVLCVDARTRATPFDYDGDGKSDLSVFRPSNGRWYLQRSALGELNFAFGMANDKLAPADYDGDGKTDVAVFRGTEDPDQADFWIMKSSDGTVTAISWGLPGDVPVVADYDGDGKADCSVWRSSNSMWYTLLSSGGHVTRPFGNAGDVPLVADLDGDGLSDLTAFRPSNGVWETAISGTANRGEEPRIQQKAFGMSGDRPVPADYDGDGTIDLAVFRPSDGRWHISFTGQNGKVNVKQFGMVDDLPTPGDYDGDGKADLAVFRPSDGRWWIQRSGSETLVVQYGLPGDKPTPNAFVY